MYWHGSYEQIEVLKSGQDFLFLHCTTPQALNGAEDAYYIHFGIVNVDIVALFNIIPIHTLSDFD